MFNGGFACHHARTAHIMLNNTQKEADRGSCKCCRVGERGVCNWPLSRRNANVGKRHKNIYLQITRQINEGIRDAPDIPAKTQTWRRRGVARWKSTSRIKACPSKYKMNVRDFIAVISFRCQWRVHLTVFVAPTPIAYKSTSATRRLTGACCPEMLLSHAKHTES
ncbi:hypothetical protein TRVL_08630 [Trypanosoma vivax]|nr:hypothetical protein TRVL_08630 [Trypanosoma vivax]